MTDIDQTEIVLAQERFRSSYDHDGKILADAVDTLTAQVAELQREYDTAQAVAKSNNRAHRLAVESYELKAAELATAQTELADVQAKLESFRKPMGHVVLALNRHSGNWGLWEDVLHQTDQAGMAETQRAGDLGAHACLAACFPVGAVDAIQHDLIAERAGDAS